MSIVVFWLEQDKDAPAPTPAHRTFTDKEVTKALAFCQALRTQTERPWMTYSHITLSSELSAMVGKPGVDSVVDGKTPDGVDYSWVKRRTTALRSTAV